MGHELFGLHITMEKFNEW